MNGRLAECKAEAHAGVVFVTFDTLLKIAKLFSSAAVMASS
jgi:hypothetical protein